MQKLHIIGFWYYGLLERLKAYKNSMISASSRSKLQNQGFTLIELSIVITIIALIAGSVLGTQMLFDASQVRQQISQIEQFESGVNTFRIKYNCLPGDCTNATSLGFRYYSTGCCAQYVNGDGNGIVTCNNTPGGTCWFKADDQRENVSFWQMLVQAQLIPVTECNDYTICSYQTYQPGPLYPRPKLRWQPTSSGGFTYGAIMLWAKRNYVNIPTGSGNHLYVFTGAWSSGRTAANFLQTGQVRALDAKMDDGLPSSGIIWALERVNNDAPQRFTDALCVTAGSPNTYSSTDSGPCTFVVQAGF